MQELLVPEGEEMDVGPTTELLKIGSEGAAPGGAAPAAAPAAGGGGETVIVRAPMDGEGVYITFHKKAGDSVNKGDVIAEVESDKATIEVEASVAGRFFIDEFFTQRGGLMSLIAIVAP